MAYDDLRQFLSALDAVGQLLRISEQVAPEPDLGAAATAAARLGDSAPALYFDNVAGFTDARVAMNVHGSWANHAIAMGMDPATSVRDQVAEFANRWDNFPVSPVYRDAPPFLADVRSGDEVDLFRALPLFRLNVEDGGFYLDKAAVISRDLTDPEHFGKQNVGVYRLQVKGPRTLGLMPVPMHDIALQLGAAEAAGQDLPVAIALGNDPMISIAAGMSLL